MDERAPGHGAAPARPGRRRSRVVLLTLLAVTLAIPVGQAWAQSGRVRASAQVSLTDDAGGLALFPGGTPLSPGAQQSRCLVVSAANAAPADAVTFAAQSVSGSLAPWLQVQVDVGSGGGRGSCAGFSGTNVFTGTLTQLAAVTGDGVATGWTPATTATRSFRITVDVTNDPRAQGLTATAGFVWRLVPAVVTPPAPTDSPTTSGPVDTVPAVVPAPYVPPATSGSPSSDVSIPVTTPATVSDSPTGPEPTPAVLVTGMPGQVDLWSSPMGPLRVLRPTRRGAAAPSSSAGPGTAGADVQLSGSLPQRMNETLVSVVRDPAPLVWPVIVAVMFLLLQHRIDLRDPKLTAARRTGRELTLRFPSGDETGGPR